MVASKEGMRGLSIFIADIRNCRNKEDEEKRVNKEFSNIRDKFGTSRSLTPYNKRKYLSKLLFAFLLGYDVDFGYTEAVSLILSNKFIDKKIAFLFLSIMIGPEHVALKLINKSIKSELDSSDPIFRSVALEAITNMASSPMATEFAPAVLNVLLTPRSDDSNKQCAAICLLALYRSNPRQMETLNADEEWRSQIIQLLYHPNLSIMSAAVSLLTFLSSCNPSLYIGIIHPATSRLVKIIDTTDQLPDLKYYQVTAPFITVKLMKLLQTQSDFRTCEDDLRRVITKINDQTLNQRSKKSQHINAKHALFFEGANFCCHAMMVDMCQLYLPHLTEMLTWDQANYRHCSMVVLKSMTKIPQVFESIRSSLQVIINLLKTEPDTSVKRTAISLLCAMCSRSNVTLIVSELIKYLKLASYDIREDLALKIPILCGQFISDPKWYVETILSLMISNGDLVGEEICNRVINMIMKKSDLQKCAVSILYESLGSKHLHDNLLMLSAYVIGEYGHLTSIEPTKLVKSLHGKFFLCSRRTQYLMLSAYAKLCNLFPEISSLALSIFEDGNIMCSSDVELQNRAFEYSSIIKSANDQLISEVFEEMPPYSKKEEDNSSVHSLFDDNAETVLFNSPEPSITSAEEGMDVNQIKKQLLTSDSGLIFNGSNISVSFQIRRNAQQPAIILVALTVASKGFHIYQINMVLPKHDIPIKIDMTPGANVVAPWGQTSYHFQITCLAVFRGQLPSLSLEYQCNNRLSKALLPFPLTISKFVVNQQIDTNLFNIRWTRIPNENQFQSVIMTSSSWVMLFSEMGKFGISHLSKINPNQNNFVGSGVFYSQSQCIGLLMLIEPEDHQSNKAKMTIKFTTANSDLFEELVSLIEIL